MKSLKYLMLSASLISLTSAPAFADFVDDSLNFSNTEVIGYTSASTSDDAISMVVNPGGIGIKGEGELFFSNSVYSNLSQTNLFGIPFWQF